MVAPESFANNLDSGLYPRIKSASIDSRNQREVIFVRLPEILYGLEEPGGRSLRHIDSALTEGWPQPTRSWRNIAIALIDLRDHLVATPTEWQAVGEDFKRD